MLNEIDLNLFSKAHGSHIRNFYDRLNFQILDISENHKKLISELVWLLLLFTTGVRIGRKREVIRQIWFQSEDDYREHLDFLGEAVLGGIGDAGIAFKKHLQLELIFVIKIMQKFKNVSMNRKKDILSDPWKFSSWLDDVSKEEKRGLVHILPHLLFPDSFERITSENMKREVLRKFEGAPSSKIRKMNVTEINRALLYLRNDFERSYGEFDFFDEEFVVQWKSRQRQLPMHSSISNRSVKEVKEDKGLPSATIKKPLNLILFGPPGTGKTIVMTTKYMPRYRRGKQSRFEFITFHQSYAYEDFVEGIRPEAKDGAVEYEVRWGPLRRICDQARKAPDKRFALFIDEINRGNVAKIFGELITLVEADKRIRTDASGARLSDCTGLEVTLPYSGETFGVPVNVDVIGTMNTADRSIALLDSALRRRFEFEEIAPQPKLLKPIPDGDGGEIDLRMLLEAMNARLTHLLHRDQTLGHSYLIGLESFEDLRLVFEKKILPFLQEVFYDDWQQIRLVLADDSVEQEELQLIRKRAVTVGELFPGADLSEIGDRPAFEMAPANEISPDAIRKIYEPAE